MFIEDQIKLQNPKHMIDFQFILTLTLKLTQPTDILMFSLVIEIKILLLQKHQFCHDKFKAVSKRHSMKKQISQTG